MVIRNPKNRECYNEAHVHWIRTNRLLRTRQRPTTQMPIEKKSYIDKSSQQPTPAGIHDNGRDFQNRLEAFKALTPSQIHLVGLIFQSLTISYFLIPPAHLCSHGLCFEGMCPVGICLCIFVLELTCICGQMHQ